MKIKQFTLLILTLTFSLFASIQPSIVQAPEANPARWIMCSFDDGEMLYNMATTDYLAHIFRSRSTNASTQQVSVLMLNRLLELTGPNFADINEPILQRSLVDGAWGDPEVFAGPADNVAVSPFDRFGMAGLRFTSYFGEWKYYQVNACASADAQISITNFGQFYDGRQEPMSTFDETTTSSDPRSIQFNRGGFSAWGAGITDIFANFFLSLSAGVVTITTVLVGLSLSDVSYFLGLTTEGGFVFSVFFNLHQNFFMPFAWFMFMLNAINLFWQGFVKRQFRAAISNNLIRPIICFMLTILISSQPQFWIPLPNQISTLGQSLIVSAFADGTQTAGGSICSTNVGERTFTVEDFDDTVLGEIGAGLEQIGINMRSVIGCRFWEEFVFTPWVEGQFGATFDDLSYIGNDNYEWVGEPRVPLGNDTAIYNWALFALSLQTDAHFSLDNDYGIPYLVDGVSNDYWRVIDALSNYHEEVVTQNLAELENPIVFNQQILNTPHTSWQHFIGNHSAERIGIAFTSLVFAIGGSIGPIVFGLLSAVYGVMITFTMMFSPLFLLFGTSSWGDKLFKGWLSDLCRFMMSRVVAGAMLIFSFQIAMFGMALGNTIGRIPAFILVVVISIILVAMRKQIFDTFSRIDFGGGISPSSMISRATEPGRKIAQDVTSVGVAAASGAVTARRLGMNVREGATIATREQVSRTLRNSEFGRRVEWGIESVTTANGELPTGVTSVKGLLMCSQCLKKLRPGDSMWLDDNREVFCDECAEMSTNFNMDNHIVPKNANGSVIRTGEQFASNSFVSHTDTQMAMNIDIQHDGTAEWNNTSVRNLMNDNMLDLEKDISKFEDLRQAKGESVIPPKLPEPLMPYIDLVRTSEAWTNGDYESVREDYKNAWAKWYVANANSMSNLPESVASATLGEVLKFNKDKAKYSNEEKDFVNVYDFFDKQDWEVDTSKLTKLQKKMITNPSMVEVIGIIKDEQDVATKDSLKSKLGDIETLFKDDDLTDNQIEQASKFILMSTYSNEELVDEYKRSLPEETKPEDVSDDKEVSKTETAPVQGFREVNKGREINNNRIDTPKADTPVEKPIVLNESVEANEPIATNTNEPVEQNIKDKIAIREINKGKEINKRTSPKKSKEEKKEPSEMTFSELVKEKFNEADKKIEKVSNAVDKMDDKIIKAEKDLLNSEELKSHLMAPNEFNVMDETVKEKTKILETLENKHERLVEDFGRTHDELSRAKLLKDEFESFENEVQ